MSATPEATRRARRSKRLGSEHETAIKNELRDGHDVEGLKLNGKEDEGDLVVRLDQGWHIVIEAKNEQKIDLAGYMREATTEADNFAAHRPVVKRDRVLPVAVVKARGKGIREAYVVIKFGPFFDFVKRFGA